MPRLESMLRNGLRTPSEHGCGVIPRGRVPDWANAPSERGGDVAPRRIARDRTVFGVPDWANAVFLSCWLSAHQRYTYANSTMGSDVDTMSVEHSPLRSACRLARSWKSRATCSFGSQARTGRIRSSNASSGVAGGYRSNACPDRTRRGGHPGCAGAVPRPSIPSGRLRPDTSSRDGASSLPALRPSVACSFPRYGEHTPSSSRAVLVVSAIHVASAGFPRAVVPSMKRHASRL